MRIIGKIIKMVKREVKLYLVFRKLSHQQIEALRRQAKLAQATRRKARTPATWESSLKELKAVVS